jgi:hypothetical protein
MMPFSTKGVAFKAACGAEFFAPNQADLGNTLFVDLIQLAEALVGVRAAGEAPVLISRESGQHQKGRIHRNELLPHSGEPP